MGNLNKVLLIGRLGQDPELRTTTNGHSVVNVSLATTEQWKDQSGTKQERTEWHRLSLWNHTANIINKYCRKGSQIFVEGSLQTREWQDKEGNKRFTTEVNVRNVQLLDAKSSDNQQNKQGTEQYNQQKQTYNQQDDFVETNVPF